ncbi:MAG: hypothetical protein R3B72_22475 [Polyangiaceae bacterium]
MTRRVCAIGAMALFLAGCAGDIGGGGDDDGPPPPPDIEAVDVPSDVDVVMGSGFCVALEAGEVLRSVSPEGHAWLLRSAGGGMTDLRVLDPLDEASEASTVVDELELAEVAAVNALSQVDAAALADDGLWRIDDLARIQLAPPEGFSSSAELCGDPITNGALLFGGQLVERRDDAQWWGWDPGVTGEAAPTVMLRHQGECTGRDDNLWLTSPDGTLWRVEPATVYRPVKFEALKAAAVTSTTVPGSDVLLGVVDGDQLWVGPDEWQLWSFPDGAPQHLTAAQGQLLAISGSRLLRYDGATWTELALPSEIDVASVEAIAPHDGGAWLLSGGELCHVATGPLVQVEGLRPYQRSKELDFDFQLASDDPSATLAASIDGEVIDLTLDDETQRMAGNARLDEVGWHEIVLEAGATKRSLFVKRLPEEERSWVTDIQPIYEAHCAGADCHVEGGSSTAPDLSTYETWTTLSDQIRLRVVNAKTMPPAANQGPDWGDEQVTIIAQWLEGGMAP